MQNAVSEQNVVVVRRRRWGPLSLRIALGLVLVALIPLIITLGFSYTQTRPSLINQATQTMKVDAQTRVQLIDNYIKERTGDVQTLVQIPTVLSYLTDTSQNADIKLHTQYALTAGFLKDKSYDVWSLYSPSGQLLLSYPHEPEKRGNASVPGDALKTVQGLKLYFSPVYYHPDTKKATIDIYVPVTPPQIPGATSGNPPALLGFARATLRLDYIWNDIVQKDAGANGQDSYAFILDDNGVRIADTSPARRFTAIDQLKPDTQIQASLEKWYGSQGNVTVLPDQAVKNSLQKSATVDTFQTEPGGAHGDFQVVRYSTSNPYVHWHYFVLSPMSSMTAVANSEFIYTLLVGIVGAIIVALIGIVLGRLLRRPILSSIRDLEAGCQTLNKLTLIQQNIATEQKWLVESSQIGLGSVQYYTDALKVASQRLGEASQLLTQSIQHNNFYGVEQAREHIQSTVGYLEKAVDYQHNSNQKLSTALRVSTQITDQLHEGATSASTTASQLEAVVQDLQRVVSALGIYQRSQ